MTELNVNMVVHTLVGKEEEVVELQAGKLDNSAHCLTCLPAPPLPPPPQREVQED